MESIDQSGVQRMCRNALALQQTLSSITASREVALDHARNFYEMLYMDPEVQNFILWCFFFFHQNQTKFWFLFAGNFNNNYWKRCSIHRVAIFECPFPIVQRKRKFRFKSIGNISTEALWYFRNKAGNRCCCLENRIINLQSSHKCLMIILLRCL